MGFEHETAQECVDASTSGFQGTACLQCFEELLDYPATAIGIDDVLHITDRLNRLIRHKKPVDRFLALRCRDFADVDVVEAEVVHVALVQTVDEDRPSGR